MTKEDAIKTLKELWRETNDSWYEEVYNMAINALEADRKTENSSEKPNNFDKDINVRSKDEPQTDMDFKVTYTCSFTGCDNFKNFGFNEKCIECKRKQSEAKHKDEPQTYVINPQEPTNDEKCFECDDFFTCGGQCDEVTDEPQTNHLVKTPSKSRDGHEIADAPLTDAEITEFAKESVHKMIDNSVIAEDAYPGLRQRMHEAVERLDEYYPSEDERSK